MKIYLSIRRLGRGLSNQKWQQKPPRLKEDAFVFLFADGATDWSFFRKGKKKRFLFYICFYIHTLHIVQYVWYKFEEGVI